MAAWRVQLQVGVTVLIALVLLVGGVFWLKEYRLAGGTAYQALFPDAGGITRGDPVMLAGVRAGEVRGVSLTGDNRALVIFSIHAGIVLHPDASFRIIDDGMMGDKALVVEPGSAPGVLRTDIVHSGATAAGIEALMAGAGRMLSHLENVSAELDSGLDVPRLATSFEHTMGRVGNVADEYGALAVNNRRAVENLLRNLEELSGRLNAVTAENADEASETVRNVNRAAQAVTRLSGGLQPFADTLSVYVGGGGGTIGKLVKSDSLYGELRATRALLDSLIIDVNKNPGRYTKGIKLDFSLF